MAYNNNRQKPTAARQAVSRASGKRTKKKKRNAAAAVIGIVLSLGLVAFVGLYAFGSHLENGKTIFPNVRVSGVDVGGLTADAARGEVEQAVADAYASQTLQVILPDQTLIFDPKQTNVALDVGAAISEAMAYGRSDGWFQAVLQYLDSSGRGHDVQLETALEFDSDYILERIAAAAKEARQDAINGSLTFDDTNRVITVTKGMPGRFMDKDGLYEAVCSAFQTGNFEPLTWEYVEIPCVEVDLQSAYHTLTSDVQDAYYDEENHEIVDGVKGYDFNLPAAQQQFDAAAMGTRLTIPLTEVLPEVDAETLQKQMFGTKLESRSSVYVINANRTENLRLACESINGTIINPGEVFSFNEIVGERTAERGFKPATIYGGDGESVDGVGGGICQVASTIYYASLYLNLETVMREPHMYQVTYVPPGMDATIYWDSGLDYRFRNNLENPIKIQANVDGGSVNITFWGQKEHDNYVVMDYKVLETWEDEDEEELDETKAPDFRELKQNSYTGAKVEAYQKVYDGSGKLLKEKTIHSTYKSRPKIYIVGTLTQPEPENPEDLPDFELPDDFWDDWADSEGSETPPDDFEFWP